MESRKGGVGKTTAALLLAKHFVEKRSRPVLFLDLDLTGTEAAQAAKRLQDHPFWKDKLNVVTKPTTWKAPPENSKNSKDAENLNLVELFERYMSGADLPAVTWETGHIKKEELVFQRNRINILSSKLERPNRNKKNGHCYGPATLFDEMHSAWFLEMLRELIQRAMSQPMGKDLLVVIDNAPGYTGLEPAIEDWLTDLGPECGKFLFVGTLDTQDLDASKKGMEQVHKSFTVKAEGAETFFQMAKGEAALDNVDETRLAFLTRLAEAMPGDGMECQGVYQDGGRPPVDCGRCELCFYAHFLDNPKQLENCQNQPTKFIGFLLNKVPGHFLIDRVLADLLKDLVGLDHKTQKFYADMQGRPVAHRDVMTYQFLARLAPRPAILSEELARIAIKAFNQELNSVDREFNTLDWNNPEFIIEKIETALNNVVAYSDCLNNLLENHLINTGLPEYIVSLILTMGYDWARQVQRAYSLFNGSKQPEDSPRPFKPGLPYMYARYLWQIISAPKQNVRRGNIPPRTLFWWSVSLTMLATYTQKDNYSDLPDANYLLSLAKFDWNIENLKVANLTSPTTRVFFPKAVKIVSSTNLSFQAQEMKIPNADEFVKLYQILVKLRVLIFDPLENIKFLVAGLKSIIGIQNDHSSALGHYLLVMSQVLVERSVTYEDGYARLKDLDAVHSAGTDARKVTELHEFEAALETIMNQWGLG